MKLGLIREYKQPADRRVALSPSHCQSILQRFSGVQILVEPSPDRAFTDDEYRAIGALITENMSSCDILLGIKEVPVQKLIPNKTYLFFSHTIKAQPHNRKLLQAILANNIRIIDYETLLWPNDGRILGFGKWAGIVGTYNAFLTWGRKYGLFHLPEAYNTSGFEECMGLLKQLSLPALKIAFTGNGRVASGVREVLELMQIKELEPAAFLQTEASEPVFVHLQNEDLYQCKTQDHWNNRHFYRYHSDYDCKFSPFLSQTDLLINGMYWEPDMQPLFRKEDTGDPGFRIRVIADISCDVEGSVPITMEARDIYHPTIGWSVTEQKQTEPYGSNTIDIMAVTNLPTEMPRNASEEFGNALLEHVIPLLIHEPDHPVLDRASLTKGGMLNSHYQYLSDYINFVG